MNNVLANKDGYEHYLYKYYLYLPFSRKQEFESHKNAIQFLLENNFLFDVNENNLKEKLISILNIYNEINKETNEKISAVEYQLNSDKIDKSVIVKKYNIIYGDIFDKRDINTRIDQRSNKNLKYKKLCYEEIQRYDKSLHDELINVIEHYSHNLQDSYDSKIKRESYRKNQDSSFDYNLIKSEFQSI